jgi:hypothetical protein
MYGSSNHVGWSGRAESSHLPTRPDRNPLPRSRATAVAALRIRGGLTAPGQPSLECFDHYGQSLIGADTFGLYRQANRPSGAVIAHRRLTTIPPAALAPRRRTTVINNPAPREPHVLCAVISGTHYCEIDRAEGGHRVRFHFHDGEWFDLAVSASFDDAIAAVGRFIDAVWDLPPGWSHERDDAIRAAVADVQAASAAPALPLAA